MIYLQLFWSFFQVGLFAFGGGYAALPLIQEQVVNIRGWLSMESFTDLVTISQMTPGPIAINSATFVGIQMAGTPGAIVATIGNIFPCVIIVLILAKLYAKYCDLPLVKTVIKGLRPAIIALIATAAISLTKDALLDSGSGLTTVNGINFFSLVLFLVSIIAYRKWKKIDPILIMIGMGFIGGLGFYFFNL